MRLNIKTLILLCTVFAGVLYSCNKNDTAEKWAKEEADLEEWIKENKPDAIFEGGIYIEKYGHKYPDNIFPQADDYVLVDYECRFLYEDVLEYVSDKEWQTRGAVNPSTFREGGPELWTYDWMGVNQLHENERANVYVPSRLLNLQDFRTRVFTIHLKKVIDTDLKSYQEKLMGNFMNQYEDDVDTITITNNGRDYYVIYHIEREGDGNAVGSTIVNTHTTEKYFLQDKNMKTCFNEKVIRWNDNSGKFSSKFSKMFQSVNKGGKIITVMPYKMMWGDDSYKDGNQYVAPINSVLFYEINIDN